MSTALRRDCNDERLKAKIAKVHLEGGWHPAGRTTRLRQKFYPRYGHGMFDETYADAVTQVAKTNLAETLITRLESLQSVHEALVCEAVIDFEGDGSFSSKLEAHCNALNDLIRLLPAIAAADVPHATVKHHEMSRLAKTEPQLESNFVDAVRCLPSAVGLFGSTLEASELQEWWECRAVKDRIAAIQQILQIIREVERQLPGIYSLIEPHRVVKFQPNIVGTNMHQAIVVWARQIVSSALAVPTVHVNQQQSSGYKIGLLSTIGKVTVVSTIGSAGTLAVIEEALRLEAANLFHRTSAERKQSTELKSARPTFAQSKSKGKRINERMLAKLQSDPECVEWSARQWSEHLSCSISTVAGTKAWSNINTARKMQQADRISHSNSI